MKQIALTGKYGIGKFALVDDEDFEELNKCKWHLSHGYATKSIKINKTWTNIPMHRLVNNTPSGLDTDHINGNRLDNRRRNLRSCSHKDNTRNKCGNKRKNGLPKGVHYLKSKYKDRVYTYIVAAINHNDVQYHLGCFKTIPEASQAYNNAAQKYHGEFARLNEV